MLNTLKEIFKKVIKCDWDGLKEDALNESITYAEQNPDKVNISSKELKKHRIDNNTNKQSSTAQTLEA